MTELTEWNGFKVGGLYRAIYHPSLMLVLSIRLRRSRKGVRQASVKFLRAGPDIQEFIIPEVHDRYNTPFYIRDVDEYTRHRTDL